MIHERYQVSGMPVGGGDRITGQYIHRDFCTNKKDMETDQHFVTPDGFELIEVQHDTIEPVRVRPIKLPNEVGKYDYYCRICHANLFQFEKQDYKFCPNCGMALDWSEAGSANTELMEED